MSFADVLWPSRAIALIFLAPLVGLFCVCSVQDLSRATPRYKLGQLVSAFAGPVGSLLNMTGHRVVTARVLSNSEVLAVVFVGLVTTRIGEVWVLPSPFRSGAMVLWNVWLAIC